MSILVARQQPIELLPFKFPDVARTDAYQPAANLVVARGTIMGQITAAGPTQGQVKPYAAANTDGSQVPLGPSQYDFSTDATGAVTLGVGVPFGLTQGHNLTVPVFICGSFRIQDLVGLDAAAIAALFARTFFTADGSNYLRIP